jgi:hypothetical protein
MRQILLWCDPYPVRNRFTEFASTIGPVLGPAAAVLENQFDTRVLVYANRFSCAFFKEEGFFNENNILEPLEEEQEMYDSVFGLWDKEATQKWSQYLSLERPSIDMESVLRRLIHENEIDLVLSWTDPPYLKDFAKDSGMAIAFMELGAIRPPIRSTVYFDFWGLNGRAGVRLLDINNEDSGAEGSTPLQSSAFPFGPVASRFDQIPPELFSRLGKGYAVVPLQLADDANVLIHSRGYDLTGFVLDALSTAFELDLVPVVKAHPGAGRNPYSSQLQQQMLDLVRDIPGALVWTGKEQYPSVPLLSNANAVLTLNSSLGFEALIVGGATVVFGDASYTSAADSNGAPDQMLRRLGEREKWLALYYFRRNEFQEIAWSINNLLILASKGIPENPDKDFLKEWETLFSAPKVGSEVKSMPTLVTFEKQPKNVSNQAAQMRGSDSPWLLTLFRKTKRVGRLEGTVEGVRISRKSGGHALVEFFGWALHNGRPPGQIVLAADGDIFPLKKVSFSQRPGLVIKGIGVSEKCRFEAQASIPEARLRKSRVRLVFGEADTFEVRLGIGKIRKKRAINSLFSKISRKGSQSVCLWARRTVWGG